MKIFGPRKFSSIYDTVTRDCFSKYGFVNTKIIEQWRSIVGEHLANISVPEKISFNGHNLSGGILHIAISSPAFALEIKAQEGRIIEKISVFFGYKAVSSIRTRIHAGFAKKTFTQNTLKTDNIQQPDNISQLKDAELKEVLYGIYKLL